MGPVSHFKISHKLLVDLLMKRRLAVGMIMAGVTVICLAYIVQSLIVGLDGSLDYFRMALNLAMIASSAFSIVAIGISAKRLDKPKRWRGLIFYSLMATDLIYCIAAVGFAYIDSLNGTFSSAYFLLEHLTAHTGEFVIGDEVHVLLFKRGLELFEPQLLGFVEQLTHTASNLNKLLGGRHLVGARRQHVAARLTLQVHDAHHVKLIEVVKEDRQELDTVKQRHFSVFSRFQNLTVKFDPADFTVGVERRAVKVDRHRRFFFLGNLGRFFSRGGRLFYYRLTAALDRICLRGCRRRFLLLVRSRNLRLHRLLLNFFCVAFSHFFLHHG